MTVSQFCYQRATQDATEEPFFIFDDCFTLLELFLVYFLISFKDFEELSFVFAPPGLFVCALSFLVV